MRNSRLPALPDGGQREVDRPDRARALADGGGDPLHRARPHVTGGEDTGHAGLVGQWGATQQLPGRAEVVARQVAVSPDEPVLVDRDTPEPVRHRVRADEAEQPYAVRLG